LSRGAGGHEIDNSGLPPYIVPGTPEDSHWRQTHPGGEKSKRNSFTTGSTAAHVAAQGGDIEALKREVEKKKDLVHAKDKNGWQPVSAVVSSLRTILLIEHCDKLLTKINLT
jgi:hypothetical protein